MPNLVGTGLNQVPTNGMLGGLAYQDPNHASIKDLDLKNLSQINSEIADTARDVFIYDTHKDSDGGAWRKRTQNTSWYNETLGTKDRGTRKQFPAVAVIVATEDDVIIYDGDDPDLPMWMIFESSDTGAPYDTHYLGRGSGFSGFHPSITSVAMLNGILVVGKDGDSSNYAEAYTEIRFISDSAFHRDSGSSVDLGNAISGRNGSAGGRLTNSSYGYIVDHDINDVAMTVLPNAPIDDTTGLPIPTIAVVTDGGVSVIRDDGNVYDLTYNSGSVVGYLVEFDGAEGIFWSGYSPFGNGQSIYLYWNKTLPVADDSSAPDARYASNANAAFDLGTKSGNFGYNSLSISDIIAAGASNGLFLIDQKEDSPTNGMTLQQTSSFNTGWMHGDIKGAFLSDTDDTDLDGGNKITNGDAWSGAQSSTSSTPPTGWTGGNGAQWKTHSGGDGTYIRLVNAGSSQGGPNSYMSQAITTVPGRKYKISVTQYHHATISVYFRAGTQETYSDLVQNSWTSSSGATPRYEHNTFTASGNTTYITLGIVSGTNNYDTGWDNVVVTEVDEDRSVNANGLHSFGTITKTPVATGAELVGYGPFTSSTPYKSLQQPYNPDLLLGSGDFCITGWVNNTSDSASTYEDIITFGNLGLVGYNNMEPGSWFIQMNKTHGFVLYYKTSAGPYDSGWTNHPSSFQTPSLNGLGIWYKITLVRRGSRLYTYANNNFIGSRGIVGSFTTTSNLDDMKLHIGYEGGTAYGPYIAQHTKMALWKISKSAPSDEQIKKMYEDEKHLFQENAKATLYGSSDVVTALAYDDTTNLLHAGTSAGRSEFQGLRRINNTTDAVTTAISASNGLVAEQ